MFSYNPDFADSGSDSISLSPRVGGLQSMATAYDASFREQEGGSDYLAYDSYWKQRSALLEKGVALPNVFSKDGSPVKPSDIGYYYEGQDSNISPEALKEYDDKIESLKSQYPDIQLRSTKEIWDTTKKEYQTAKQREVNRRGTTLGAVGGFVGDIAGMADPRANLINTVGMVAGGEVLVGAKAGLVKLAASEGAVQSAITAASEATGARSFRKALGGDGSIESSIENVLTAGVGGTAFRGVVSGVVRGTGLASKRWFQDAPGDPAPEIPKAFTERTAPEAPLTPEQRYALQKAMPESVSPELSRSRAGTSRVLDDVKHFEERLQAWDGESPIDVRPRTSAATFDPSEGVRFSDDITTRAALNRLTPNEAARRADPDTFRVYDSLAEKADAIRAELAATKPDTAEWSRMITEANNKVSELTDAIGQRKLSAQKRNALVKERDAAMAERDNIMSAPRGSDTPRQSALREDLQKYDYKMRDMAPLINRAYERGRGEFGSSPEARAAIDSMVKERRAGLTPAESEAIVNRAQELNTTSGGGYAGPTISRISPEDLAPGDSMAHAARKVVEADVKVMDESLEVFRSSLGSMLKETNEKITIGKHEFNMSDTIEVPNPDGLGSREITVRELLDEMLEDDYNLKAMKTCSM